MPVTNIGSAEAALRTYVEAVVRAMMVGRDVVDLDHLRGATRALDTLEALGCHEAYQLFELLREVREAAKVAAGGGIDRKAAASIIARFVYLGRRVLVRSASYADALDERQCADLALAITAAPIDWRAEEGDVAEAVATNTTARAEDLMKLILAA
jgi:hypothetical protein